MMAKKRMFSNDVVSTGRFMYLPPTARLLYYDLGMAADDEGAVEALLVLRFTEAKEEDLFLLQEKGFIKILDDNLVSYIIDWNRNNTLKSDRFHDSIYKDLISDYLAETDTEPKRNQNGTKVEPIRNRSIV